MRDRDYSESAEFLARFFGETTEHAVELRSCTNEPGAGPGKSVFTRDAEIIETHCQRWDGPGRGMYFGVCTRQIGVSHGRRADLAECPALWTEIDTDKLGLDKDKLVLDLDALPFPPSVIVDSGGGLHTYWLLSEAIDITPLPQIADNVEEEITDANRQLAAICGCADSIFDLPRIMRLPGTLNTKEHYGEPRLVRVIAASWKRYELRDLVEWLDWQRPIISLPEGEQAPSDPFLAAAQRQGFRPPVDVEQRLHDMAYLGSGDRSVHQTQLSVSAALVRQGMDTEEIVDVLLRATRAAAGGYAERWNWRREEKNIRAMIDGARQKFASEVVSIAEVRERKRVNGPSERVESAAASDDDKTPLINLVGQAALDLWERQRGPLMLTGGQAWTYAGGWWRRFDDELDHIMRVNIQGITRAMGKAPSTTVLNGAWRFVMEHPDRLREGVAWNASRLVVCRNGAVDPVTRIIQPHSPEHFATYRIEADANPVAGCPIWLGFLERAFSNVSEDERASIIGTLAEFFGASLVRGKSREMTKGLLVFGPSRTGKTQLAQVFRAVVGGQPSGMRARDLEEHFGMQSLIGASAWIADDAISTGEYLDAERYKVIVTGEPISIPRKNKVNWEGQLDIPVCLTANHLPRVRDQSHAVYNRSLLLPMTVEQPEQASEARPISETIIRDELGGVLNWAMSGLARLLARRFYAPPAVMVDASKQFEHDNNPIGAWLATAVEATSSMMVDRRDLLASFNGWLLMEFGPEAKPFGGRTVFPAIRRAMPLTGDHVIEGVRYITGLKLTSAGLASLRELADQNYGKTVGSGQPDQFVNRMYQDMKKLSPTGREPRF